MVKPSYWWMAGCVNSELSMTCLYFYSRLKRKIYPTNTSYHRVFTAYRTDIWRAFESGHLTAQSNTTPSNTNKFFAEVASQWETRGWGERTAPSDTIHGVTPKWNYFWWLNLERTLDKRCGKMGLVRIRQPKKGYHFPESDTKKGRQFFKKKGDNINCRPGWHQP